MLQRKQRGLSSAVAAAGFEVFQARTMRTLTFIPISLQNSHTRSRSTTSLRMPTAILMHNKPNETSNFRWRHSTSRVDVDKINSTKVCGFKEQWRGFLYIAIFTTGGGEKNGPAKILYCSWDCFRVETILHSCVKCGNSLWENKLWRLSVGLGCNEITQINKIYHSLILAATLFVPLHRRAP